MVTLMLTAINGAAIAEFSMPVMREDFAFPGFFNTVNYRLRNVVCGEKNAFRAQFRGCAAHIQ